MGRLAVKRGCRLLSPAGRHICLRGAFTCANAMPSLWRASRASCRGWLALAAWCLAQNRYCTKTKLYCSRDDYCGCRCHVGQPG